MGDRLVLYNSIMSATRLHDCLSRSDPRASPPTNPRRSNMAYRCGTRLPPQYSAHRDAYHFDIIPSVREEELDLIPFEGWVKFGVRVTIGTPEKTLFRRSDRIFFTQFGYVLC